MAQTTAKGNLTLTIEENELEARFDFVPHVDGGEWTAEKVFKLAMDARIGAVNQKRAEEIVSKFARSKGPASEVAAKGQAPENPVPEQIEWAELSVPDELRDLVSEVLDSAGDPVLYRTKVENVKTEKKVSKPSPLPFLPPKMETVVVTERVETRERVYADANIVKSGFVRKGDRIGVLYSAKPGKLGKSIFGKPLHFSGEPDSFILGNGLVRDKSDVVAGEDGVLRAGIVWAEILPVAAHRFTVERSSNGTTFLLDYHPGHPGLPALAAQAVIDEAVKLGAIAAELIGIEAIEEAIASARARGAPLEAFSLSPDRDAMARVEISPDGLRARLTVLKGQGRGKALELRQVTEALKAAGLKGLPIEEIKKSVLAFYKGADLDLRDLTLIDGKAPTRGKDRSLTLTFTPLVKEKAAALRARLVDHIDLDSAIPSLADFPLEPTTALAFVSAGQKVGELSPPSLGQPGLDIRGRVLPGIPGNDPVIQCHEGASFAKGAVTATRDGLLMAEEREGAWHLRVVPYRDASIEVQVSNDGMEGLLSLSAEEGLGLPLEVETVIKSIGERGITFGIDPRAIADAVADARAGKPVLRRPIARGKAALPAGGARIEWLVGPGGVPSSSLKVSQGQEILRISSNEAEAEEGCDVLGKQLLPPPGASLTVLPDHDAAITEKVEAKGRRVFVAAVSGELLLRDGRLTIRDKLSLGADLAAAQGELRFAGAIEIKGSIRVGAKVFAGGDISVGGAIEAAVVSSEGSVAAVGGVKGAKRGTIRAMRNLDLGFAEQTLLLAVEDIRMRGACMLCNVKTNGKLSLGGAKGNLVGGLIRARKGVEVETLGSENGVKTEVAFGQDYLVADMIENEEREIEKVKTAILQSDRVMAELERAGASLDQIRQDKVKLLKLLEKRSVRLFDFREKFEQHFPAEVRVRGTVFPGVILESHNRFFEVRSRKTGVIFSFDPSNGRITERPLK